jgi:hypothetical protein
MRRRLVAALFFAPIAAFAACNSSSGNAGASDAGAGDDSGDAAAAQDATGDGDAWIDVTCPPDPTPPPTSASRQTVSFNLTNTSSSTRYVAIRADSCAPFGVAGVTTHVPQTPQCVIAPLSELLILQPLAPNESTTLAWDARDQTSYVAHAPCQSPPACLPYAKAAALPIDAGAYVATFIVASSLPTGSGHLCVQGPGDIQCAVGGNVGAPQDGGVCDPTNFGATVATVTQGFTLPASGDLDVNVAIP